MRIFLDTPMGLRFRQRGRAPRGGGGPGLFPWMPESWLWYILVVIIGVIAIAVTYRDVARRALVINPVVIDPVVLDVHDAVVPGPPPLSDDEESVLCLIVATQWPKSHVLDKGLDPIYLQLVPQDRSVLHGLWGDVKVAGPSLPFDCSMVVNDEELFQSASRNWPNLDPRNPRVELKDHNCKFWAEQWNKHGVDTGLTQEVYMELALALFYRVAPTLDDVLLKAIRSAGASSSSSSSSSKHHASSSGKCEAQDSPDFQFPKRKTRKPEVHLDILELEAVLARHIAKPKVLCRTPPGKIIFHSVHLKVRVKVTKYSSASALPLSTFLPYPADKQCDDTVILP